MSKKKKDKKQKYLQEKPYVYMATPAYDGKVHSDYAQSLIEASQHATIFGIQVTGAVMGNSAFIDLARNNFVHLFLKDNADCTHLFFIDSDLKFGSDAFIGLVQNCTKERPLVCGAYPRRMEVEDYPVMRSKHPDWVAGDEDKLWIDDAGFLMCDRAPTGFMCIHRSLIEKMIPDVQMIKTQNMPPIPRLFYTYIDDQKRFVGEDFAFCDDALKAMGHPLSVWMDFDFVHDGHKGNYEKYLSKQVDMHKENKERRLGQREAS